LKINTSHHYREISLIEEGGKRGKEIDGDAYLRQLLVMDHEGRD
jgi:hypothetical protein